MQGTYNKISMDRSLLSVAFWILAALFMVVSPVNINAQKPIGRDYLITLSGLQGNDGTKLVLTAVKDQDPNAIVSVAVPIQQAKVRTIVELDQPQLATTLAPWGITVVSISIIYPTLTQDRSADQTTMPDFPQLIDTGHPDLDAADYHARKELWIVQHPGLYPPSTTPHALGTAK